MFRLKPGVNPALTFEMALVAGYVTARWISAGLGPLVFTSLADGAHMHGSRHASGNAADIRTRHLWAGMLAPVAGNHASQLRDFVTALRSELQPHGVDVVLHPEDDPPGRALPPHLHIEFDPRPEQSRTLWTME
jgi:hypothetical protein